MAVNQPWLCRGCQRRLGYIEKMKDGRDICRIKYKDLFVEVIGGDITENCTRCGTANVIRDDVRQEAVKIQNGGSNGI